MDLLSEPMALFDTRDLAGSLCGFLERELKLRVPGLLLADLLSQFLGLCDSLIEQIL